MRTSLHGIISVGVSSPCHCFDLASASQSELFPLCNCFDLASAQKDPKTASILRGRLIAPPPLSLFAPIPAGDRLPAARPPLAHVPARTAVSMKHPSGNDTAEARRRGSVGGTASRATAVDGVERGERSVEDGGEMEVEVERDIVFVVRWVVAGVQCRSPCVVVPGHDWSF